MWSTIFYVLNSIRELYRSCKNIVESYIPRKWSYTLTISCMSKYFWIVFDLTNKTWILGGKKSIDLKQLEFNESIVYIKISFNPYSRTTNWRIWLSCNRVSLPTRTRAIKSNHKSFNGKRIWSVYIANSFGCVVIWHHCRVANCQIPRYVYSLFNALFTLSSDIIQWQTVLNSFHAIEPLVHLIYSRSFLYSYWM